MGLPGGLGGFQGGVERHWEVSKMNSVRTVSRKTQDRKTKKKKAMLKRSNSPFMPNSLLRHRFVSQGHAHPLITLLTH